MKIWKIPFEIISDNRNSQMDKGMENFELWEIKNEYPRVLIKKSKRGKNYLRYGNTYRYTKRPVSLSRVSENEVSELHDPRNDPLR